MADVVDKATRSRMMAGIKAKDTAPELVVRRFLHSHGLRYRLNDQNLPGKPDVVFRRFQCVVFVHGCFWHRHAKCRYAAIPKTRPKYWHQKFEENVARDRRTAGALRKLGWRVLTIWECQLDEKHLVRLHKTIVSCRRK